MSLLRPPTGTPIRSLCLLSTCFLLVSQLRLAVSQEQPDVSASGYTCIPECGAGKECVLGTCTRQECSKDCSNVEQQLVCGSNGITYNSPCELEKARCEQMSEIKQEYEGTCITPPPPPIPLCTIKQEEFDNYTWDELYQKCLKNGYVKYGSGELGPNDIVDCFRPQCNTTNQLFIRKQCSLYFPGYCWCTTPEGTIINDTFQSNMPAGYCDNRKSCEVDGVTYKDGTVFTKSNICGLCECLDGTDRCFKTFDLNGTNLDDDQLYTLKNELIQVFNFQYNHNDHVHVDIRHIFKHPAGVTESKKDRILDWKFSHYNRNRDSDLNSAEEFLFHEELLDIYRCSTFIDQLSGLMDANADNKITKPEWKAFFDLTTQQELSVQPVKREALLSPRMTKKPLHLRKKFYYILH